MLHFKMPGEGVRNSQPLFMYRGKFDNVASFSGTLPVLYCRLRCRSHAKSKCAQVVHMLPIAQWRVP